MIVKHERGKVYATPRKFIIAWLVSFICMFALTAVSIQYANYAVSKLNAEERENDRKWCDLVVFYTDYYREKPPETDIQRRQFTLMEQRRIDLGCR